MDILSTMKTKIAWAVIIYGAILSFHFYVPEYLPKGPELLENSDFSQGLSQWDYLGPEGDLILRGGEVRLYNNRFDKIVSLRQTIHWPVDEPYIQLSATLRSENIHPGSRSWHVGRLVLPRYNSERRWLDLPHYAAVLEGSQGWQGYSEVFSHDSDAVRVDVALQMPYATGLLAARDVSLRIARPSVIYPWVQCLSLLMGVLFVIFQFKNQLISHRPVVLRLCLFVTCVSILAGTLVPQKMKQGMTQQIQTISSAISSAESGQDNEPEILHSSPVSLDKVFHFAGFFILGGVLCFLVNPGVAMLDGLLLACMTELLQNFIPGRTPLVGDVAIDFSGLLAGYLLFKAFSQLAAHMTLRGDSKG